MGGLVIIASVLIFSAIMISAGVMDLLVLMPFALLVASRSRSESGIAAFLKDWEATGQKIG